LHARFRILYYASALSVAATWAVNVVGNVPGAVLTCATLSFMCVIALGVSFPALGVYGRAIGHVAGARPLVALTFDDGPHPVHTLRVLDALDAVGAHATFFAIAERVERHADLAREIVRRGHEVALHSHGHDPVLAIRSQAAVRRDFERSEAIFEKVLGARPKLYRPPAGVASPTIHAVASRLGYVVVGWSVRSLDGLTYTSAASVRARIGRRAGAGDVVLLHDAHPSHEDLVPAGVVALPDILADFGARGLRVTTVSELISGT
jgi:peptidoglycan/xylan/chitin deacetylase (PgdA/CDA1 family)